ncbi:MAG TPA: orotidine-5'-phosphate decarboxylase, partial [Pseudobdellovibrionaceae bacterium]|nr:orotidine-5'-phosphate decarboxylase [Pseudobdellovibrionaceae bacterium]
TKALSGLVGGFKIGPRLCLRYGEELIREVAGHGPVFMDNKHFDISSTMEAAVRASFDCGASVVTVHALSGLDALKKMAALEAELGRIRPFRILAVTVLTSWDQNSLPPVLKPDAVSAHVTALADLAASSGLKGIVCSPHELESLRDRGLYILTPGIRFPEDEKGDQKRVAGPAEALRSGARALVVGRPIVQAKDPRAAAERFLQAVKA